MTTSKEFQAIIAAIPPDFAAPEADYQDVRAMFAAFHGHPVSADFTVDTAEYGGVRCGQYALENTATTTVAFHCHGGALVSCPLDEYHFYAEIIARHTACSVVMPDYRLAPEHPYPAAHEDCYAAYCGLVESGVKPSEIVLIGESCGGALAVALMLQLRDRQQPLPSCFISLTGWFDLSVAGPPAPGHDPFLTPQWVRNRGLDYTAGKLELDNPLISPAYADLRGLPPMYLQVGEFDTVREGAIALGASALRSGVQATLESWPGMVQGWHGLVNAGVPEAAAAWAAINKYLEQQQRPQGPRVSGIYSAAVRTCPPA